MRKRLGLVCIAFLSFGLLGCQDSANSKFNELAKQGLKDDKNIITLYDFKDNKTYTYTYFQDPSVEIDKDEIEEKLMLISTKSGFKNCTATPNEMFKIAFSNNSLTFSCIHSLKDMLQSHGVKFSEEDLPQMDDKNIKITIIGKDSTDNDFIEEKEKHALTIAFNTKSIQTKDIADLTNRTETLTRLKDNCEITQDGQYDDCMMPSSRIFVTGL